jgi:hypothetical protein
VKPAKKAVGIGFIINSNLSLILKKSSGSADPGVSMWLRPSERREKKRIRARNMERDHVTR